MNKVHRATDIVRIRPVGTSLVDFFRRWNQYR